MARLIYGNTVLKTDKIHKILYLENEPEAMFIWEHKTLKWFGG